MRTTLDLDEDVLAAAKELAKSQNSTVGKIVSKLVRQALTARNRIEYEDGIPVLPTDPHARIVTMELVNQLRDELP